MHSLLVSVFGTWASGVLVADTTGYHTSALQRQRDQVRVLGRGVQGRELMGVLGRGVPIGGQERDVASGEECRRVELGEENGVERLRTCHPMPRAYPNAHQSLLRPIPRGSRRREYRRRLAARPQRRVEIEYSPCAHPSSLACRLWEPLKENMETRIPLNAPEQALQNGSSAAQWIVQVWEIMRI